MIQDRPEAWREGCRNGPLREKKYGSDALAGAMKTRRAESLQEIETSALKCGCRKRHLSTTLTGMYV